MIRVAQMICNYKNHKLPISLFILTILFPLQIPYSSAQESEKNKDEGLKPNKLYFMPLPALSYKPAFGFVYGLALSGNMVFGETKDTRLSSVFGSITYSTKKQFLSSLKHTVYTNHDKWMLIGDWRFYESSQPTYGLGTGPQSEIFLSENEESFELGDYKDGVDLAELMEFRLIRINQLFLRQIKIGFFGGIGYAYERYANIQDELLDLESDPERISNHYAYSLTHNVDPLQYTMSGPSAALIFDTRDNINNPYRGRLVSMQFNQALKSLGSERNFSRISLEYRDYFNVSTKVERNLIAVWSLVQITPSGTPPYMFLPALGWDQLQRSGRGNPQGRFRGENLFYLEAEYRFRIPMKVKMPLVNKEGNYMGGVLFANTTSTSSKDLDVDLFNYIRPSAGVGLRFMFNKATRSNVSFDYGISSDGLGAFYFNLNEYF